MAENDSIRRAHNFKDLTGQRFGRWTVLEFAGRKSGVTHWLCVCECGTTKAVCGQVLVRGNSKSCGCLKRDQAGDAARTHGGHGTAEYQTWISMKARCLNPKHPAWPRYGGRGITICERWLDFDNFLADMGHRPVGLTLDRIDNDGNYEPGNCRWATDEEQQRNTRKNVMLTFQGRTQCVAAWAEERGMRVGTIWNRLGLGWSAERAITTPEKHC